MFANDETCLREHATDAEMNELVICYGKNRGKQELLLNFGFLEDVEQGTDDVKVYRKRLGIALTK